MVMYIKMWKELIIFLLKNKDYKNRKLALGNAGLGPFLDFLIMIQFKFRTAKSISDYFYTELLDLLCFTFRCPKADN